MVNPVTWRLFPYAPFIDPLPRPTVDPDQPETVCIELNREYIPYIIGALETLIYPDMFVGTTPEQQLAKDRFENLILMFMLAKECDPCLNCDDDCAGDCAGDCDDCEDC